MCSPPGSHIALAKRLCGLRIKVRCCVDARRPRQDTWVRVMSLFRDKRILVTGGAGFLGSHLCEASSKWARSSLRRQLFHRDAAPTSRGLLGNPFFEAIRHDVTFPLYVEVDAIFNFACPASPVHYQHDPVATTKVSVHGAINALGLAKRLKAQFCRLRPAKSTVIRPYIPNPKPTGDMSIRLVRAPATTRESAALKRYFLTTDGSMDCQIKVDANFQYLWSAHAPKRWSRGFELHRAGAQGRTDHNLWQRRADTVVLLCGRSDQWLPWISWPPRGCHGPMNFGNPKEFTIKELALAVLRLTNSKSAIIHEPLPQDDPRQRQPDIRWRARPLVGSRPLSSTKA